MQRLEPNVLTDLIIDELKQYQEYNTEVRKAYERFKPMVENRTFKIYTESHVVSKGSGRYEFNIPSETRERFMIRAERISEETFVCFLATDNQFVDYMMSVVYSRINGRWRIQKIHIGTARIAGSSSLGWYKKAQALFEYGNVAQAFLCLEVSRALLRPSPFMQYDIEKEIIDIYTKFNVQIHSKLYVRLVKLPTSPKLYNISSEFIQAKMVPKVKYVSGIELGNEIALRREASRIAVEIDKLFPGFAKAGSTVACQAYTEIPSDPNKSYENKEFTIKVE
jgi:hypothetical protein